jgi:hypothetical protein
VKLKIILLAALFNIIIIPQNVKITDYRVPVSRAHTLRFDGSWDWSQTGSTVNANNGNANLTGRIFYSSLPLAWFIDVNASGKKIMGDYNHSTLIDASFFKYVWDKMNWFGFARLRTNYATDFSRVASDLTVGGGYGRYINATALAKAVRIEEHLLRDKIIKDHLPKETMIEIANIIERESEFRNLYGEVYENYWFDEIESTIQNSGYLIEENIGSLGLFRMRQVLFGINERVNHRYYGWDLTVGILFPISDPYTFFPDDPNLSIAERHAFPITWKTQVNTTAEVFTPINELFFKQFNSRLGVDFIYELSNRINFVTAYQFSLFKPYLLRALVNHYLTTSFWYYLENQIYFTVSGDYIKRSGFPVTLGTRIGIQYNLF